MAQSPRFHIVLIPGFAGFDALGQLEYYSGVTSRFQQSGKQEEVLHYFDNLPTAAVETRAARLRDYLAKRIARGEISSGDHVALVGHSTGGLDIRWLLWELNHRQQPIRVDGGLPVKPQQILDRIRRVVFLSVPHWGTNIANWVCDHSVWRKAIVEDLRVAVAGSQVLLVDRIERAVTESAASLTRAGLIWAIRDALSEANERNGDPGAVRKSEAYEAASELGLYARDMASDFRAIDDLAWRPPGSGKVLSPAHFGPAERTKELTLLRKIKILSYVTLGRRPYPFNPGVPAPTWKLACPWTYPEVTKSAKLAAGTDIVYRTTYRACAGGPFKSPSPSGTINRRLNGTLPRSVELWDNDGIVNTLSMLWPKGENVLVPADHMDIVGQYRPVKADAGAGRKFRAYDLLKSESGFSDRMFKEVWSEIFTFCGPHDPGEGSPH